jgi:hypothetical protein
MTPKEYQQSLAALRSGQVLSDAAQAATGQTFLMAELSKLDPVVRLPLENFTYLRDIPLDKGGGWVMNHIAHNVDFRGPRDAGAGSQTNDSRVIEYNVNQDTWPVYPYQVRVRIPIVESLRMAQVGRSPQDLLDKGVRVDYSKTLDTRTYQGFQGGVNGGTSYYGLIGNPAVTNTALPATGTGGTLTWSTKTAVAILGDFNFMALTIWNASGNAPGAMPTRFLVPPTQWVLLTQPMAVVGGPSGYASILDYIQKNYLGAAFGIVPEIYPLPEWLEGAGPGPTQLIMAYKYDKDCLSLGIPQEITRFGAPPSIVSGCFEFLYLANIGVVKVNRPQTVGGFYGC